MKAELVSLDQVALRLIRADFDEAVFILRVYSINLLAVAGQTLDEMAEDALVGAARAKIDQLIEEVRKL